MLYPIGWDAFGLPAENFALKTGIHPAISTKKAISNIKKQLLSVGFGYDWEREITTSQSDYYKWTQWMFLQLYIMYMILLTVPNVSVNILNCLILP